MAEKNTNAVAGLVLGILSLVLNFVPYLGITTLPVGIVGLILSVKGRKIEYKKGMATAGMVLSIIGLALWALLLLCVVCAGAVLLGAAGMA